MKKNNLILDCTCSMLRKLASLDLLIVTSLIRVLKFLVHNPFSSMVHAQKRMVVACWRPHYTLSSLYVHSMFLVVMLMKCVAIRLLQYEFGVLWTKLGIGNRNLVIDWSSAQENFAMWLIVVFTIIFFSVNLSFCLLK